MTDDNVKLPRKLSDEVKLPRKLSDEPKAPKPKRRSHADVIESIERWANSSGLQPPKASDAETI